MIGLVDLVVVVCTAIVVLRKLDANANYRKKTGLGRRSWAAAGTEVV